MVILKYSFAFPAALIQVCNIFRPDNAESLAVLCDIAFKTYDKQLLTNVIAF
jgi:hypothetical protein